MAKRFTALLISIFLTTTLLTPSTQAAGTKIAIAYEAGGKGDNGINDLASLGLERAIKKNNISRLDVREQITDGTLGDRITRVRFLAKSRYQLIICVGAGYADTVRRISVEFPNTQFAIIDDQSVAMTNVSNLSFATEEGIYLAASALALASKSGKIGFIGDKSEASAVNYSQVFARGAVAANSKIKVSSKLLDDSTADEVKTQVATGIDQLFSTWARSDEVIATIAALNDGSKKVLISGLLPDQYFLNFTIGKKNQYLTISKRFDLAVEQVISAEVAGKDILDILDSKKGIYGHRYNIKDGGVVVKTVSGAAFPAKVLSIMADIKAGKVKNFKP